MSTLLSKETKLESIIREAQSVLIGFSGGIDSTYLATVALKVLGKDSVLAVIASSPTYPAHEIEAAKKLAKQLGLKYQVIETNEMADPRFASNPKERCYYCKQELFGKLIQMAKGANDQKQSYAVVADGSNADDLNDFRPGSQAKTELGVRSPLQEAGFTKAEIREAAKAMELPNWDKPSLACLSSRVPYGTPITVSVVKQIGEGENYLHSLGLRQVRVRHHGIIARIEVDPEEMPLVMEEDVRNQIAAHFQNLGYTYVSLDLKGYRTGSMNEVL